MRHFDDLKHLVQFLNDRDDLSFPSSRKEPTLFKNADNLSKLAMPPVRPAVQPFAPVVVAAGYQAVHTIAVQIAITQFRGKTTGAFANTMGNKAHRLDVTRMFGYTDPSEATTDFMREVREKQMENDYAWLKTRLGHKDTDRMLRPDERHSLVMFRTQQGLVNTGLKAWLHMYSQVQQAIAYAQDNVVASRGDDQYALLMLVSVSEWVRKTSDNYPDFHEAIIRGISDLEVVCLAPEPGIGGLEDLPDGFPEESSLVDDFASDFVEK